MTSDRLIKFVRDTSKNRLTIDNQGSAQKTQQFATTSVKIHSPENVLIIGSEISLACALSSLVKNVFVLVEDGSLAVSRETGLPKNVRFICGRATDLPIDYHSVKMAICADYLDLYDSSRLIDELKRALEFEGLLMIAGRVCNDDDLEGIYDELYRKMNPFHNDFYLVSDLKTMLGLKEIKPVNEDTFTFTTDMSLFSAKMDEISGESLTESALSYIDQNRDQFSKLYDLDSKYHIKEHYYTGLFRCQKPEFDDYEEEVRKVKQRSGVVE